MKYELPKRLQPGRLVSAEHTRQRLAVDVPDGITPEAVLVENFWGNYTGQVRPRDILEIVCEDGSWEGQYRVLFVNNSGVRLAETWVKHYDVPDFEVPEEYEIRWNLGKKKFDIHDKMAGVILKEGFYPKSEAYRYLAGHLQGMRQ